jgi:predicted metal-dependent phosphoesterase TrpH
LNDHIDLHIHSTASDGTLSPAEILVKAIELNLRAIAITDHDTIEGSKWVLAKGLPAGLQFLTGVEISANPLPAFPMPGSLHILGYAFHLEDLHLNRSLYRLQKARRDRNPRIIQKLNLLGFDISFESVISDTDPGCQIGRPHIARYMVKRGYAKSLEDAFNTYLSAGKPAYVEKFRVECAQAIKLIRDAGGIPVLAHPGLLNMGIDERFESMITVLKSMGLRGMEVYYPDHTSELTFYYADLAKHHDLLLTGGTDFHGTLKPDINMGSGYGDLAIPYTLYEKLITEC